MVTFMPVTVRSMVHLFGQLKDGETEAEEYFVAGVDYIQLYPEQEGITPGSDEVRIVVKNWMTANEMGVLVKRALVEIVNEGIISKSEWLIGAVNAV